MSNVPSSSEPELKPGGVIPDGPMLVDRAKLPDPIIRIRTSTNASTVADQLTEVVDRLAALRESPDAMVVTFDHDAEK